MWSFAVNWSKLSTRFHAFLLQRAACAGKSVSQKPVCTSRALSLVRSRSRSFWFLISQMRGSARQPIQHAILCFPFQSVIKLIIPERKSPRKLPSGGEFRLSASHSIILECFFGHRRHSLESEDTKAEIFFSSPLCRPEVSDFSRLLEKY